MHYTCLVYPDRNNFWSLRHDQLQLQLSFHSDSGLQSVQSSNTCCNVILYLLVAYPLTFSGHSKSVGSLTHHLLVAGWNLSCQNALETNYSHCELFNIDLLLYTFHQCFQECLLSKTVIDLCCTLREIDPVISSQTVLQTNDQL